MESVWHTFKTIYDKGYVYRGTKIMPYSTRLNTVLANFEAGNDYRTVPDPAIIVTFPILEGELEGVNLIAWTTTPWTLPSNLAVAVHPDFDYVHWKNLKNEQTYVCLKERFDNVIKDMLLKKADVEVIKEIKGTNLVGAPYKPLFTCFEERRADGCFKVIGADFVTKEAGTGMVHCAPGFGADDYKYCLA